MTNPSTIAKYSQRVKNLANNSRQLGQKELDTDTRKEL